MHNNSTLMASTAWLNHRGKPSEPGGRSFPVAAAASGGEDGEDCRWSPLVRRPERPLHDESRGTLLAQYEAKSGVSVRYSP